MKNEILTETTNIESKKWYQSKTMWINIIASAVDIATGFATGGALTALSIANMILRTITKEPISK